MCIPLFAKVWAPEAISNGLISLAPVANDAYGRNGSRSAGFLSGYRYKFLAMRYVVSTTRSRPTICDKRAYAQLIEYHVISSSGPSGRLTPSVISKTFSGSSGLGSGQGIAPSMRSSFCTPACTAAARINILILEPVCRVPRAMLTSLRPATNGLPPTIALTAPVLLSNVTIAVSMPAELAGN